jgi:acyl transferase domain-containing protein/NAD(P)-dependent dehydrogenase (short-subunit alcohol dehydrogenase family)/acyl carrier protein
MRDADPYSQAGQTPLAIIGVGCLFPGATDFRSFWSSIVNKVDSIRDVPPTHWRASDYLHPDPKAPDRVYAARGGFLDPVPFNPTAFGIPPSNLEATDSSQLLGLVVAQQALEDCGYSIVSGGASANGTKVIDRSRIGVILGVTGTLELVIPLGARLGHPIWRRALEDAGVPKDVADDVVGRISDAYVGWQENSFPGLLGNVVAGRIANRFDLGGTNCVVDAACASSLSAIHLAAMELITGRADMVLTGGVDTFNDIFMFTCFSKTPALSPTGNARPFDAQADGAVLGEGLGMVVLKRLDDARRDKDRIYAVLRGVGTSSDGKGNAIYAPRKEGQIDALRTAYRIAGVSPATVELVEAHGTGTKVGDATEVSALTEVYAGAGRTGPWCALGSIKSQLGHTKAAAGVAGLLKAAAALHHKVLPPTIKVTNPLAILHGDSPFYVNTEKRPWLPPCIDPVHAEPSARVLPVQDTGRSHPRRAAVSAFGFGGSNFHCVLEEAGPDKPGIDWIGDVQLLAFAAESVAGLKQRLAEWPADLDWPELRIRAARSRREWRPDAPYRLLAVVQRGKTDMAKLLTFEDSATREPFCCLQPGLYFGAGPAAGRLAVLFPGQGAQYLGMLRDLACHFPPALQVHANADRAFSATKKRRLIDLIYPHSGFTAEARTAQEEALRATDVAQPALGAVSLGAWRVLESFGVQADAFAGHSYGELTALCAAGRLSEDDFHSLSIVRGEQMAEAGRKTPGGMLAVKASLATIEQVLLEEGIDLVLANKNAPEQSVLSGSSPAIDSAVAAFAGRRISTVRLSVAAAFHSPHVAEARVGFLAALEGVALARGRFPVSANSTAADYPDDPDGARALLGNQLARPVEWLRQIEALYDSGVRTFLEAGPGARLSGLVEAILQGRGAALALDASSGQRGGFYDLADCLARLAARGHAVDLAAWDPVDSTMIDAAPRKPAHTVNLCGANYVKPRPPRPPAPSRESRSSLSVSLRPSAEFGGRSEDSTPAEPALSLRDGPSPGAAPKTSLLPNLADGSSHPGSNGTTKMNPPIPPPPSADRTPEPVLQALQITRESLAALQKMQEQTAQLHRQFLDGQEQAHRTVHLLVEQQQRLLASSLGLPAPLPAAEATPPPVEQPAAVFGEPQATGKLPVATVAPASGRGAALEGLLPAGLSGPAEPSPVQGVLLEVIAEKTGYPVEMLEPGMSLDADLGIDSIKRVEILSALQERLPDAPSVKPEHLGSLHTLADIASFLADSPQPGTPAPPARSEKPPVPAPTTGTGTPDGLERSIVHSVPLPPAGAADLTPIAGAEVWISNEDHALAAALASRLTARGLTARLAPCADLVRMSLPAALGGLILLSPPDMLADDWLRDALMAVKQAGPGLRKSHGVFATVARLDGAFGLSGGAPWREPFDGGLAGLAKTARHEWPEVSSRAIDLALSLTPDLAAAAIEQELFLSGPVEVGLSPAGRVTLERAPQRLPAGGNHLPFAPDDVVIVSGGARGVTAEAAVALARHFRPALILLGRSPEPSPEPDWQAGLADEPAIKRELSRRNPGLSPRSLGEQSRAILATREVRANLARIEAAGGKALYRSVDVRDAAAVAAVVREVRQRYGPVRGLIHGAGVLADARIEDKTGEQFDSVYGPKVVGLRSLLAAVGQDDLRALVLFSSSTARFGRTGQVDYAIANEVLNKLAWQEAARRPSCRVASINWGPWDGGMVNPGLKRLFAQEGIGVIPLSAGAELLVDELRHGTNGPCEVVVLTAGSATPAPAPPAASQAGPNLPPPLPLAFERVLELNDCPVLAAHVLDGRPVLPLALILEWLAHAALVQNPGYVFHGCDDLRVLQGVTLEGDTPPLLRVGAGKAVRRDGFFMTSAELRSQREGRDVLHARAEIVLAAALPSCPAAREAPLLPAWPHSAEEAYRRGLLFHGPALRCIEHVHGCGEPGVAGAVRSDAAPADWQRQPLRQRWLSNPLAIDGSFQLMILWSHDQRGAVCLPCHVRRYRQYRRAFPERTRIHAAIDRASNLHVLAGIEFLDAEGKLIARIEGCECVIDPALRRAFQRNVPASV